MVDYSYIAMCANDILLICREMVDGNPDTADKIAAVKQIKANLKDIKEELKNV